MFKSVILSCLILLLAATGHAASLLYFEAQGVGGYSTEARKPVFYSQTPDAEMQKPGVGFDYLQRISGASGDIATFALQSRLALTVDNRQGDGGNSYKAEPQVYNAYVKARLGGPYVWLGHNRPAFGLSSYFDSHALLLRTLAVQGFGYDRDWGTGMYKDFSWGDFSMSATTGSGMPLYVNKGTYMTAARVSYGVLSRDNRNIGFSVGYGNTLETMGYKLLDPNPGRMALAGVDMTLLRDNFEHRVDSLAGKWLGQDTYAVLYRFGVNFGPEARFKLEAQPAYWKVNGKETYQFSLCGSCIATSNLTVRLVPAYDSERNDKRVIMQLYYYVPI